MSAWNIERAMRWYRNNLAGQELAVAEALTIAGRDIERAHPRCADQVWGGGHNPGFGLYVRDGNHEFVSIWWIGWAGGGRNFRMKVFARNSGWKRVPEVPISEFVRHLAADFPAIPTEVSELLDALDLQTVDNLREASLRLAKRLCAG